MKSFGVVSLDAPSSINIYCDSFEDKDMVADYITKYNESVSDEYKIKHENTSLVNPAERGSTPPTPGTLSDFK